MNPDETRAVARLPHLDIELHHRRDPEEGVETLSVTLRGRPDLDAAMGLLDPFRLLAAWSAFNPWLVAANPWLAAWLPPAARAARLPSPARRPPARPSGGSGEA